MMADSSQMRIFRKVEGRTLYQKQESAGLGILFSTEDVKTITLLLPKLSLQGRTHSLFLPSHPVHQRTRTLFISCLPACCTLLLFMLSHQVYKRVSCSHKFQSTQQPSLFSGHSHQLLLCSAKITPWLDQYKGTFVQSSLVIPAVQASLFTSNKCDLYEVQGLMSSTSEILSVTFRTLH